MREYFLGVDLGQMRDPTALAGVRRETRVDARGKAAAPVCRVGVLRRLPLGLSYAKVADEVGNILRGEPFCERRDQWGQVTRAEATLVVDATGVGAAVTDIMVEKGLCPQRIVLHGGERAVFEHGVHRVPKRDLLMGLLVAFQEGRLLISRRLPDASRLIKELMSFSYQRSAGRETYAHRDNEGHADLTLAVALAYWYATRRPAPSSRRTIVTPVRG